MPYILHISYSLRTDTNVTQIKYSINELNVSFVNVMVNYADALSALMKIHLAEYLKWLKFMAILPISAS